MSAGHRSCLDFHNEAYLSTHTFSYLVCLWSQSAIKFFWNLCLPYSNSLSCSSLNNTWYCSRKPPTHRTWFLRTKAGREILVYGIWESLHHRNILEFPFRIIFQGSSTLHQSSPGETGQLLGITTRTLALEVKAFCAEYKFLVGP